MTRKEFKYIFMIISIFIAACIETDIYLPAFPDMMEYFNTSEEAIQALLTWNFFGICISGPFYGPLSDAFGRKMPLLVALGLFFVGSILTLFCSTFDQMLLGRLLQGVGSGGCFTIGTAVIFDIFNDEKKAVGALAQINSTVPFIMAGAPLLGGYLNYHYGFRSNFIAIACFVFFSLLMSIFFYKESLPKEKRIPLSIKQLSSDYKRVFTCLPFWQVTYFVCIMFAAYIAFLSTISVLYVRELGISKGAYPFYQAAMVVAWLVASLSCTPFMNRYGTDLMKRVGKIVLILSVTAFTVACILVPHSALGLTLPMCFVAWGVNWTQAVYFPEGMGQLPDIKGIASSVLTSFRLLIAGVVVTIVSYCYDKSIYSYGVTLVLITITSLTSIGFYERAKSH